jgi:hypothetical protein
LTARAVVLSTRITSRNTIIDSGPKVTASAPQSRVYSPGGSCSRQGASAASISGRRRFWRVGSAWF